eukprot:scaffold101817_cov63-Phaeocystis_antarctica.AAC.1
MGAGAGAGARRWGKGCGARTGAEASGRCSRQNTVYGLVKDFFLALGAEADSGGAALLSGAFLGGALGGAEDAPACRSATCWTSTAEAHAAAFAGVAEGVVGA